MPDLQTELLKVAPNLSALHFDDDEDPGNVPVQVLPTTAGRSGTHRVFDYVKAHPGSTAREASDALGLTMGDVAARLVVLVRHGHLTRADTRPFRYTAAADEYRPMTVAESVAKAGRAAAEARQRRQRAQKAKATRQAKREASQQQLAGAIEASKQLVQSMDTGVSRVAPSDQVKQLISTMSLAVARELYGELKAIFGGV